MEDDAGEPQPEGAPALVGMARYEKGAVIGEGTFGVVCRATDRLARCVAS